MTITATELRRVHWQCRRGMLELDLLLAHFFIAHFIELETTQQTAFIHLLTYPDPLLYDWLIGDTQPEQAALHAVVAQVRTAYA
ncbi:succinate dehydrogenase assembly factor 2 [Thiospirillum jenense]|uniref:FAD assembly factor SdhE n=1 Tax=Thiospirillum jenense TaxID=1653858 RepID=A0A839HEN0_9GAMM|nr:succinate dehydrogenase assembly factor 2 [Thiospirillum jenense]MBB1126570.1 succinate dehydrogenase assembly factor 2 [Thiospirillum jenense]